MAKNAKNTTPPLSSGVVVAHCLQDLAPLRRTLAQQRVQRAAHAHMLREQQRQTQAQRNLFAQAVGPVQPLKGASQHRYQAPAVAPAARPLQHELDKVRVLREAMSDEFDVSTLLDTDDQLSFRRPGIGRDVTHKLRAGHWSIQRQLDLHGLRRDEAREALGQFIRLAQRTGLRCVRIIHGKGLGSPGKTPVLKGRVQAWLVQKKEVLAFVQARPAEGGAGALVVLLQPS